MIQAFPFDAHVFDCPEIILPSVIVRELVKEVAALLSEVDVSTGDRLTLSLLIVRLCSFRETAVRFPTAPILREVK